MGTPSLEDLEYKYDLLCRLLEEGRSCRSPLPAATAAPSQSQSSPPPPPPPPPLPQEGGAPCTTSEPRRRTPAAWVSGAIRGFFIMFWLLVLVVLVAPTAMQSTTDKEHVFYCVGIFLLSLAFPIMGYVGTWDEPGWL